MPDVVVALRRQLRVPDTRQPDREPKQCAQAPPSNPSRPDGSVSSSGSLWGLRPVKCRLIKPAATTRPARPRDANMSLPSRSQAITWAVASRTPTVKGAASATASSRSRTPNA